MRGSRGGVGLVCSIGVGLVCTVGCGSVSVTPADGSAEPAPDDAGSDVAIPTDADLRVRYDVAYINDITITPATTSLFSFLVVVNRGVMPLDVTDVKVDSFTDDNPGIDWTFRKEASASAPLPSARAAGSLSIAARTKIVDSGLVPEMFEDPFLNFSMSFATAPPVGLTLNAQAVLEIDDASITLPFVIHIVASGDPQFNARRIGSQP